MRVYVLLIAALCSAVGVGVGVGVGVAAAASEPLFSSAPAGVSARVISCDRDTHKALFRAAMRRVPGTDRMGLRFTLLRRSPGERFARVRAPGLSRWKRSRRGVRRFAHRQRVRGLSDGLEYRVRVDFRWFDDDGDVIRRRRTSSRVCSLVEPLPNLRVTAIDGFPEGTGERYLISAENAGRADSPEAGLRLDINDAHQRLATLPALAPGQSATVGVSGPRCTTRLRAVVDAQEQVWEAHEDDNALTRSCP